MNECNSEIHAKSGYTPLRTKKKNILFFTCVNLASDFENIKLSVSVHETLSFRLWLFEITITSFVVYCKKSYNTLKKKKK